MRSWYHRTMYRLSKWRHWRTAFWNQDEVRAHEANWREEFGY